MLSRPIVNFWVASSCPACRPACGPSARARHSCPPIAPEPPEHLIGANTVAALNNGAMFGTAAQLDGLADRVEAELGQPLTVVVTGGLAPYITPCCKRKVIYDADLLFKGLALIWEKNKQ